MGFTPVLEAYQNALLTASPLSPHPIRAVEGPVTDKLRPRLGARITEVTTIP